MINDWVFGQPTVILISGKAGSGKTIAAKFFMEKLKKVKGILSTKESFATAVKEIAKFDFGWNEIKDLKGRKLLQNIGNVGREYDKNLWVKKLIIKVYKDIPPNVLVVDDWRFPNEVEFLEESGFKVYKIRIISDRVDEFTDKNDISEISLDNYDNFNFEIINNKSMKEFEVLIDLTFQLILKETQNG